MTGLADRRSRGWSRHRGACSPLGSGLAQQAQARAQLHAGGQSSHGLEALCTAMGGSGGAAAARSLVDDVNAALSAVSGGRLPQESHGAHRAVP